MKKARMLAALPAVVVGGALGLSSLVLADLDRLSIRIAEKIAGVEG